MSDPAIEAAKGAFANMPIMVEAAGTQPVLKALVLEVGTAAAREALKPIREWYKWWNHVSGEELPQQAWSELARRIYTTEDAYCDE